MKLEIDPDTVVVLKERGGHWAVYQNQALDSVNAGHLQFLRVGEGCTHTEAPPHLPDTKFGAGWKYVYVTTVEAKELPADGVLDATT